jgi:hypothetical protein
MPTPWNVDELEIVGYGNVLTNDMLPSVVPPVFRLRSDANRALLPPYSFNAGFLCNATEVSQSELEDLRHSNEITLFGDAFPARAGFELWVDQAFQPHYQPRDEANRKLSRIAAEGIKNAGEALRRGNLEEAQRLSGIAISADDKRVEPLAIKAAIRRVQGNETGERLMAELAAPVLEERLFKLLVDNYCRGAVGKQPTKPIPASSRRRMPRRSSPL